MKTERMIDVATLPVQDVYSPARIAQGFAVVRDNFSPRDKPVDMQAAMASIREAREAGMYDEPKKSRTDCRGITLRDFCDLYGLDYR